MAIASAAAAAPAVTSVFQVVITEVLMLISGVCGWFAKSAMTSPVIATIEADVASLKAKLDPSANVKAS